jgi:hypothetical protein
VSSESISIDPAATSSRASSRARAGTLTAEAIQFPVIVWVVHFLLSQIPASLAYHYGTQRPAIVDDGTSWAYQGSPQFIPGPMTGLADWIVGPMRLWDGSWYRLVAKLGYEPGLSALAAYFPAYPWMMKWGHQFTGWSPETIGYLISNIAFLGALVIVYRLVTMDFSAAVARRTLWALALFPTAFFFSAVYTESLFLLLAVATLYAARRGEWWLAGVIGIAAAMTRNSGVMLLAPMGVLFLQQFGWRDPRRWFPQAFGAALPVLGIVFYGWILKSSNMKFFDWVTQQWQWNRFSAMPWRTFQCTLDGCTATVRQFGSTGEVSVRPIQWGWISNIIQHPIWTNFTSFQWRDWMARGDVLEFVVTIGAFALVIVGFRKVPLYYIAFVLPPLIVPLFSPSSVHPLMSIPRFVLPLFPLFVVIALLVTNRRAGYALAVLSSIGLVLLTMQFAQWYWVA